MFFEMLMMPKTWDCPGEAHSKDCCFNPSSQGPYGPGYHDCDICDNEYVVTKPVHDAEVKHQKYMEEWRRKQKIKRQEEREQKKVIDKIMELPRSNVPLAE